jgi:hypothetical protein
MAPGCGLSAIRSVALFRMDTRGASWPVSECEGSMVALVPALAAMPPNLSLNPDASPAALSFVR